MSSDFSFPRSLSSSDLSFTKCPYPNLLTRSTEAASSLAALADPTRRRLYRFVADAPGPVSREEAAEGVGVAGHTAKFHLDRLVEEGLLDVEFRRLTGRTGPGAGRPAKLYRRSEREMTLSLPPRHYDLLSKILARSVEEAVRDGAAVGEVLTREASETGQRARGGRRAATVPDCVDGGCVEQLQPHGYEPRIEDERMVLENCPFDKVAQGAHRAGVRAQRRVRRRDGGRASAAPVSRSAWNRRPGGAASALPGTSRPSVGATGTAS